MYWRPVDYTGTAATLAPADTGFRKSSGRQPSSTDCVLLVFSNVKIRREMIFQLAHNCKELDKIQSRDMSTLAELERNSC